MAKCKCVKRNGLQQECDMGCPDGLDYACCPHCTINEQAVKRYPAGGNPYTKDEPFNEPT